MITTSTRSWYLMALAMVLIAAPTLASSPAVDGVIGLSPVGENSCIAVEIDVSQGQALSAIQWYNNDASQPFPQLLLMEGEQGAAPDLANTALLLADISGESLAWGEATLETPVTSSTGTIYAVFVFPAYQERGGEGLYGGPGIGYHTSAATKGNFLSQDGIVWAQLHPGYDLAVIPLFSSGKGRPLTLAQLRAERDDSALPTPSRKDTPTRTRLSSPFPNPFNPRVEIPLDLSRSGRVMLDIYDTRGRRVHVLLDEARPAGHYQIPWLGVDDRGQSVASGVYYVQMNFEGENHRQRLALVR